MLGLTNRQGKRRQPKSRSRDDDRKVPSIVKIALQEDDHDQLEIIFEVDEVFDCRQLIARRI